MADSAVALQYQMPLGIDEVRIHKNGRDVTVEVGPISARALVVQMVPVTAGAVFTSAVAAFVLADPSQFGTRAWIIVPLAALMLAIYTLAMFFNRDKLRTVMVVDGRLCFDNAIGLGLRTLPDDRPWRLVVRRRWWMPWHVRLDAVPNFGFWTLHHPNANEPITLLSGLKRSQLKEIAHELSNALTPTYSANAAR